MSNEINIRSTQKLATSKVNGLCDIQRTLLDFNEDLKTGYTTLIIKDTWFQEQVVGEITERKIITVEIAEPFKYSRAEIDAWFTADGTDILTSGIYSNQSDLNKLAIFKLQSSSAGVNGWREMNVWIDDTEHNIVTNFSE